MKQEELEQYYDRVGDDDHLYNVDDFIRLLQSIPKQHRKLPFGVKVDDSFLRPVVSYVTDKSSDIKDWDNGYGKIIAIALTT